MEYKIVADSSSNVLKLSDVAFASVPMKVVTADKEYVDTPDLDVIGMVNDLAKQTAPTRSSCPNTHEWLEAFGEADGVFGVTITSKLSGSYNAAVQAAGEFIETHKNSKIHILDSLSAGPELTLLVERLRERILAGDVFENIKSNLLKYQQHTHLIFSLKSLANLARNGRVSPAVAKIAGVLGIYVVGKASDGTLEPTHKCRGEKSALKTLFSDMQNLGFRGGKVRIAHCMNLPGAEQLKQTILSHFPGSDVEIDVCKGLCSFYAEIGGLLVGFEDALGNA